jgi:hypothetical protein
MDNNKKCVVRAYVPGYVSDGVSKWNVKCTTCMPIAMGKVGRFCVLLSVGILPKLLVNCFIYGVDLFNVCFHMCDQNLTYAGSIPCRVGYCVWLEDVLYI